MADMLEYYQQISELKKAVRERELHRLELEKQTLLSAQKRERRHEDFKDKIREIQRELAQKEMEAAQNFQSLLARVDSIRREHQLLAAHTEQLRHRKLQYEMSLKSANPILHTAVHQDLSGILTNSGDTGWKEHFQATSTPSAVPQLQQTILPQQPQVSPITSYNLAPASHLSTQPMERHIPREVYLKANQQQPFTVPMTSLSMPSTSLTDESLSHSGMFSHIQHGNMIKTPSTYNQPSKMDYLIPHDVSREPLPRDGMVSHPQGNMVKAPITCNQPPHVDFMHPHVSREPLTHNGIVSQTQSIIANTPITHNQSSHVEYTIPHVSREALIQNGMVSQTQGNTAKIPTTYMIPDGVSRTSYHQSHPTIQPATRDPLEYNRSVNLDTPLIHTPDALVTNKPTPNIPVHLQSIPNPSATNMNYLNQPQLLSSTNSLQTNPYPPNMHNNLPTAPTNGVTNYSPAKFISEKGFESEYTSPHLKTFSHDSINHETPPSSLNNTLHAELDTQYNRATLPQPSEIYKPQSDLLVNREIPEKDTNDLHASILRQNAVEVVKVPNTLREGETTKTSIMSNMDDKPREMFSPRNYYDERPQSDNPVRGETNSNTINDLPLTGTNILKDSDYNNGRTDIPERSTINNIASTTIKTDLVEAQHGLMSQTEPSLMSSSQSTVNVHENGQNPNPVQTTDDMISLLELKPRETLDTIPNNSEENNRMMPLTQHKSETKEKEFKLPSSSEESPSSTPTNNNSPDRHVNSSKEFPSSAVTKNNSPIRPTSPLLSQVSQKDLKSPDRQSSSSTETLPSPPTKNNSPIRPITTLPSKAAPQNPEDSDTDFFDQNINVTDSAAYKSLVGGTGKGSDGTDTENDEAEGQVSGIISKPQTPLSRPVLKPFASSIPSLRPAPPDTDTDSVDSVEAAIQAAMKKRDHEAVSESSKETPHLQSSLKQETKSETAAEHSKGLTVKPGMDKILSRNKQSKTAAVPINLDSECESYEVSAGGEASDEDDFDFYDKF